MKRRSFFSRLAGVAVAPVLVGLTEIVPPDDAVCPKCGDWGAYWIGRELVVCDCGAKVSPVVCYIDPRLYERESKTPIWRPEEV